jgi:imidazolonepropionase-like amidohydrolase
MVKDHSVGVLARGSRHRWALLRRMKLTAGGQVVAGVNRMRIASLVIAGTLVVVSGDVCAAAGSQQWVVYGKKIYTAPDAAVIDDGVVVVRDGRIAAVGKRGAVAVPAGAQESTCSDGFITAGFQDSHVHFTGQQFQNAANAPAPVLEQALAAMLTRSGFTTVVDVGSDGGNTFSLRDRIEKGEVRGPRILAVGWPLYPANGVPFYLDDLPRALLDRLPQPANVEEALKVVRSNMDGGADGTKLFIATPQRGGTVKRMAPQIAYAAVEETHRRGKLAMAHPTDIDGVRAAATAGVDILLHTTLSGRTAWPDDLVLELVAKHVSLVPTLKLWRHELDKANVPASIQAQLIAPTLEQLRSFAAAGGQVLFGTDIGYMTDFDLTEEYELLATAGRTPMQILASLTTTPAMRWNESKRRGRIAPGMDADLVVLAADPAADPKSFAKVRCTFRHGASLYDSATSGS